MLSGRDLWCEALIKRSNIPNTIIRERRAKNGLSVETFYSSGFNGTQQAGLCNCKYVVYFDCDLAIFL